MAPTASGVGPNEAPSCVGHDSGGGRAKVPAVLVPRMMPDSRAGLILVLAAGLAVFGSFGYGKLLQDDERHQVGGSMVGTGGAPRTESYDDALANYRVAGQDGGAAPTAFTYSSPGNGTLLSLSIPAAEGSRVRLERDSVDLYGANNTEIEMDVYVVPMGEGPYLLDRSASTTLAFAPAATHINVTATQSWALVNTNGNSSTYQIMDSTGLLPLQPPIEATVPQGAAGVDIVWLNHTDGAAGSPQLGYAVTKTDARWINLAPAFAGVETLLVAVAGWAAYTWLKRSSDKDAPRPDTAAATDLIAEAGTYVARWRNTLALVGLLLVVTLWLGRASLETILADEVPDARSVMAARFGYLAGSALLVLGWLAMVVRAHRETRRWSHAQEHGPNL